MIPLFGIRSERIYSTGKPIRDPAYLRFIRGQPCVVCGSQRAIEAAHQGPHGIGQRSCDRKCLPLCATKHHRVGPQSYHVLGPVAFAEKHGLDIPGLIVEFNREYDSRESKTA